MKYPYFLVSLLMLPAFLYSQAGEWVWVKGDTTNNFPGSYGTRTVASPTNNPPAYDGGACWTDSADFFWLFVPPSLWKFDPVSLEWAWMNGDTIDSVTHMGVVIVAPPGIYADSNAPGGTYFSGKWITPDQHLWAYGGYNDYEFSVNKAAYTLWQYSPALNQWAWMGTFPFVNYGIKGVPDTSNSPGDRVGGNSCSWTDSAGNLWLFGGFTGNYYLNDMWKYDVSTGIWTWMSGTPNNGDPGVYGVKGVPSINNCPPGRATFFYWKDDSGNFWLIGGGQSINDNWYNYQDIWRFNPQTLEWTWMGGPQGADLNGPIGSLCDTSSLNSEGARQSNTAVWKVCNDLIVNYSGMQGLVGTENLPEYDDLWAYRPSENVWVKLADYGDTAISSYGMQGVASAQNHPCGRYFSASFKDKYNNLWLFGGEDYYYNVYGDLWKYTLDTNCAGNVCTLVCNLSSPVLTASADTICPSDSAQICASPGFSSYAWNTSSNGSCIEAKDAGDYYVTITDNNGCTAESNHISITVLQSPIVSISQSGDTLRVYNAPDVQWYLNGNAIPGAIQSSYIMPTYGTYMVSIADTNRCTTFSSPIVYTGIENTGDDENISIYPNPLPVGPWQLTVGNNFVGALVEIIDDNSRIAYKSEITKRHSEIAAQLLPGGVYLLRIITGSTVVARKLVKL